MLSFLVISRLEEKHSLDSSRRAQGNNIPLISPSISTSTSLPCIQRPPCLFHVSNYPHKQCFSGVASSGHFQIHPRNLVLFITKFQISVEYELLMLDFLILRKTWSTPHPCLLSSPLSLRLLDPLYISMGL